jgi:hypothetical protein
MIGMKQIKSDILIVGGGTAGLVSALILNKRFPNKTIKLVKSDKIGIIGVGEGSTEHFKYFLDYVGIDDFDLIKNTDATIKLGVFFENWTDNYFHNVDDIFYNNRIGQYQALYGFCYSNNISQIKTTNYRTLENKVINSKNYSPTKQYHFNTFKLNDYFIKICKERNIEIIEDEIKDVIINENNEISYLIGDKINYTSDFYIDSTGFKKLLISKLGAKWQSYKDYLKMNEAIAFPTGDTDEYTPYTTATAMKYGWKWRIPTYGRWGNGYVFCNEYINADQAQQEVEELLGHKINVAKNVKFDPGALDNVWIKNCLAIGLSANFVEPLEATSIGTTIYQMFMFTHYFQNSNETIIKEYNKKMNDIMINIRDFIILHYMVDKNNSQFWIDIKKNNIPDTLKYKLSKFKNRLPILEDFKETNFHIFFEANWASVLYGLKLMNVDLIKEEFMSYRKENRDNIISIFNNHLDNMKNNEFISHKEYLNNVRNA